MSKPDGFGKHYILDEMHAVVPVDQMTWAKWFGDFANRRVAETFTLTARISTVFLGLDHQFGKGPPLVFETMAFEKEGHEYEFSDGSKAIVFEDLDCVRYSSWDDAVTGHKTMVRRIAKMEADAQRQVGKTLKRETNGNQ